MKLTPLGANKVLVEMGENKIFFSYTTPVVAYLGWKWYKTNKKWSNTTSKHITSFLKDVTDVEEVEQRFFDNLAEEISFPQCIKYTLERIRI